MDTHAFLHGQPTCVPGSWLNGYATGGNPQCQDLPTANDAELTARMECSACKNERGSRVLVASGPDDPRISSAHFAQANVIVPNNDVKYHINKVRSRLYANVTRQQITYSQALDKPSAAALRASPQIAQRKLWLTKDESGNRIG